MYDKIYILPTTTNTTTPTIFVYRSKNNCRFNRYTEGIPYLTLCKILLTEFFNQIVTVFDTLVFPTLFRK